MFTTMKRNDITMKRRLDEINKEIYSLEQERLVLEEALYESKETELTVLDLIEHLIYQVDELKLLYNAERMQRTSEENPEQVFSASAKLKSQEQNKPVKFHCSNSISKLANPPDVSGVQKDEVQIQCMNKLTSIQQLQAFTQRYNCKANAIHELPNQTRNNVEEQINENIKTSVRKNSSYPEIMSHLKSRYEQENDVELEAEVIRILKAELNVFKVEFINDIRKMVQQTVWSEVNERLKSLERDMQQLVSSNQEQVCKKQGRVLVHHENLDHGNENPVKKRYLDYGSGMALHFFESYLRLVLPVHDIGTPSSQGIKGRIITYISDRHLCDCSFPVKKLFVLVPQNLQMTTDLRELSKDDSGNYWMELVEPLEPEVLHRVGVKGRTYHNTVYRIKDLDSENEPVIYVVAVVSLKSLFDIIQTVPREKTGVFIRNQQKIISKYCETLKETVNMSDACKNLCEIVEFSDKDNEGKRMNVARLILDRINKICFNRKCRPYCIEQRIQNIGDKLYQTNR